MKNSLPKRKLSDKGGLKWKGNTYGRFRSNRVKCITELSVPLKFLTVADLKNKSANINRENNGGGGTSRVREVKMSVRGLSKEKAVQLSLVFLMTSQ